MLRLIREQQTAAGTIGHFETQPHRIFTLERPWIPAGGAPCGQKGVSCIPPGVYRLEPHNTEAHPRTVALVNEDLWVYHLDEDVPAARRGFARTAVLIHPANYVSELRGCIAPGWERVGFTVQESRRAFDQLVAMAWPAQIEIVAPVGV